MLIALLAAACSRHHPTYYIVDPATGHAVPVVQRYQAQPQYADQAYAGTTVTQPSVIRQHPSEGRGLLTRRASTSTRQAYVRQPYAQQSYAQQAYPQQAYPQQSYAQNGYVQQQPAGPQSYVLQYHPPQASAGTAYAAAPSSYAYAPAAQPAYTLDSGDKLRVVVFGQEGITGIYTVDAGGQVNLPLIGAVPARGYTTHALSQTIAERLKQGYVREPHVTVEIAAYRPFFILGEVTAPGQYPYVPNMTAEKAIAIAGGFAPRAKKKSVELTRNANGQRYHGDVPLTYPLKPGDTIVVKERWF